MMMRVHLTITDIRAVAVTEAQEHIYTGQIRNPHDGANWVMGEALREIMAFASKNGADTIDLELSDDRQRHWIEIAYPKRSEGANLIIASPGKFEGEPLWVPYYYDLWILGCASGEFDLYEVEEGDEDCVSDTHNPSCPYFELDEDDYRVWPELKHGGDCADGDPCVAITLEETEQGFVNAIHYSKLEWAGEKERLTGEKHEHVWGDVERSPMAGNPHRKCQVSGCKEITLDLVDDIEGYGTGVDSDGRPL